ncbi:MULTISPECIES: Uma2 family endonuclease [Actinosynnema]|uniref:Uma2 family endonuclease n=1 Tax=Actinosynnema TaxID=40566 RepID=UPI0020A3396C|nr:Uma2 family endonuclease [Actinosynnema pretiosum]MCP2094205.1 Endonuclease, Uma2 family (restriction endonuclease fold) [Actinosynnema pretiosum]
MTGALARWDALPEHVCRAHELVAGELVPVPPPAPRHQVACARLATILDVAPGRTAVLRTDVVVGPATVRAPDVVVVPSARLDEEPVRFDAEDVLLAVEVVSPGTGRTDRVTKLAEYRDAGIPDYWIIELDDPVSLTAFTLVDGEYRRVASGSGEVELASPFPLVVDLAELLRR